MVEGARALGSAFQKVNFLRDLASDLDQLGRSYFPGVNAKTFNEETKRRLVAEIDGELAISARSLPLLPSDSRVAVAAAQMLFEALNRRIANTPAATIATTRISVGNFTKLALLVRAYLGIFPKA
jgi:phytoene/squalene synthetase